MAWKLISDLTSLKNKLRQTFIVDSHKILLIWHDEKVHAVQAQCPHLKLPLTKATINEAQELVCPFHKSAFDLNTGAVKCWSPWPPVLGNVLAKVSKPKELCVYATRIEGDQIYIEIV